MRADTSLRLGVLYPSFPSDPSAWVQAEDDYTRLPERLATPIAVELVHTHWEEDDRPADDPDWAQTLKELGSDERLLAGAAELRPFGPDVVAWACTSGSFLWGVEGARRQARVVGDFLGVPATSTSLAFLPALAALGVTRVAIASIYHGEVSDALRAFLATAAVETVGLTQLDHAGLGDFATWGRAELLDVVARANVAQADAIVIPETALHTIAWVDALEASAGKPVLTSNQVTVWHALRLAGRYAPHDGLGSLFRCG